MQMLNLSEGICKEGRFISNVKVSFSIDELPAYEVCQVAVEKCEGKVCPRCWNITDSSREDGLCDRCHEVLEG